MFVHPICIHWSIASLYVSKDSPRGIWSTAPERPRYWTSLPSATPEPTCQCATSLVVASLGKLQAKVMWPWRLLSLLEAFCFCNALKVTCCKEFGLFRTLMKHPIFSFPHLLAKGRKRKAEFMVVTSKISTSPLGTCHNQCSTAYQFHGSTPCRSIQHTSIFWHLKLIKWQNPATASLQHALRILKTLWFYDSMILHTVMATEPKACQLALLACLEHTPTKHRVM